MHQLEVDVRAVRPGESPSLEDLGRDRPRDHVPGRELEDLRGVLRHEPLPRGVLQDPALAAGALGDEDAAFEERGRVELDELHVLQERPRVVGRGGPVPGAAVGVRRPAVDPTGSAGGDDDGLRRHLLELTGLLVESDDPLDPTFAHDDPGQLPLLVEREPLATELLPQSLQQREPGPVGGVDRAREPRAPERPLGERTVVGPAEDGAEMLHLDDRRAGLFAEELDRVLVAEVVGPLDRVEDVRVDRVVHADRRVDAALRRPRMRPKRVQLRDDGDVPPGLDRREGRALTGETRAHHYDFVTQHRKPRVYLSRGFNECRSPDCTYRGTTPRAVATGCLGDAGVIAA